ncbi:hypothetical protein ABLU22_09465 [Acinetobacter lwoffii]|jgi:hypothetical protein|uniref:hypothetical protein n=1 Tax=Acinetobacter lwoffii TaxID=28090 RepID=UPI0021CDB5DF|nr:hypothetical protein [Acinetobacter lwoffii]MCU4421375.1 hypothetical protein [Acinetobacter lwoffii]MCU4450414.1 hypothetical protein [Acinetobacter lwoffii]
MSFSKAAHILFISFLLIALYLGICIHTALNAPASVTQYLFSESGAFEVMSPWLWYLLAVLCLLNVEIKLNTRVFTAIAATLLGLREMDFHKQVFEMSFIKTNFYRSAEIPLMDKLLGFILLIGIIFVFLVLAKKLVQTIRSMKDSLNIAHFFIFLTIACGGLSKVLDRTTSTLKDEFGIQLVPHTQIMIMTIEEGVEMLLPVLLIVAVLSYRKVLNQAQ